MKKRRIILALLLMITIADHAQVFIQDDEFEGQIRLGYEEYELITPYQGADVDQFTPTGSGLLALTGLAGAYLIAKRKKKR